MIELKLAFMLHAVDVVVVLLLKAASSLATLRLRVTMWLSLRRARRRVRRKLETMITRSASRCYLPLTRGLERRQFVRHLREVRARSGDEAATAVFSEHLDFKLDAKSMAEWLEMQA